MAPDLQIPLAGHLDAKKLRFFADSGAG